MKTKDGVYYGQSRIADNFYQITLHEPKHDRSNPNKDSNTNRLRHFKILIHQNIQKPWFKFNKQNVIVTSCSNYNFIDLMKACTNL